MRLEQQMPLAKRVFQRGLLHRHVVEPGGGVEMNIAMFRLLANDLAVHLTFRGNINDHINQKLGMTAESAV